MQAHFSAVISLHGNEADLRKAPLNGHLPAFKTDLVIPTGSGSLALMAAAAGLALAGRASASHSFAGPPAAGLQRIQTHGFYASSIFKR